MATKLESDLPSSPANDESGLSNSILKNAKINFKQ